MQNINPANFKIRGLYILGYTMTEIASELSITRNVVAGWVYRHRHELPRRKVLEPKPAKDRERRRREARVIESTKPAPLVLVPKPLPPSKERLRRELTEAVRNTAALPVDE